MKPPNALARRLSSLALSVAAIPGPALHSYPGLGPVAGSAANPVASVAPFAPVAPDPAAGTDSGVDPDGPADAGVPDGWAPADPGSALVTSAATFAAGQLGEEFAGVYVVEDVHSAATQVVSGTNVLLRIRVARVRNAILGARKECGVVVYLPPGAHRQARLASFTCQSVDSPAAVKVPM
jgi:hypothetical protein